MFVSAFKLSQRVQAVRGKLVMLNSATWLTNPNPRSSKSIWMKSTVAKSGVIYVIFRLSDHGLKTRYKEFIGIHPDTRLRYSYMEFYSKPDSCQMLKLCCIRPRMV
jgi:hypothetical protein